MDSGHPGWLIAYQPPSLRATPTTFVSVEDRLLDPVVSGALRALDVCGSRDVQLAFSDVANDETEGTSEGDYLVWVYARTHGEYVSLGYIVANAQCSGAIGIRQCGSFQ